MVKWYHFAQIKEEGCDSVKFGFFIGLPYETPCDENFEEYKKFSNSISKEAVLKYLETVDFGLTTLPSYDIFTGEKLHAGMFWDGDFYFPYEFLHYYKNYDIGIPYEYEEYLKKKGVK